MPSNRIPRSSFILSRKRATFSRGIWRITFPELLSRTSTTVLPSPPCTKLSSMPMFSFRKDCTSWATSDENPGAAKGKLSPLPAVSAPALAAAQPWILATGATDWASFWWSSAVPRVRFSPPELFSNLRSLPSPLNPVVYWAKITNRTAPCVLFRAAQPGTPRTAARGNRLSLGTSGQVGPRSYSSQGRYPDPVRSTRSV